MAGVCALAERRAAGSARITALPASKINATSENVFFVCTLHTFSLKFLVTGDFTVFDRNYPPRPFCKFNIMGYYDHSFVSFLVHLF